MLEWKQTELIHLGKIVVLASMSTWILVQWFLPWVPALILLSIILAHEWYYACGCWIACVSAAFLIYCMCNVILCLLFDAWCCHNQTDRHPIVHWLGKYFCLTRLETRTKESYRCASSWVAKPVCAMKVLAGILAPATDQLIDRGLSLSISIRTRKMVNYAWTEWIQGKLWWRFVSVLTCKSFVILGYMGRKTNRTI